MSATRYRLRLAAALLAWTGLLALPLRTIAACPMLATASETAPSHHVMPAPLADSDEHAGHDMGAPMPQAPSAPDAPAHEACPDLAHCAVAAVPTPLAIPMAPTVPVVALRVAALTAPLSVARGLEPPPPKA